MELYERIGKVIDHFFRSKVDFYEKIDVSSSTFNGYMSLEGQDKIRFNLIKKILDLVPELSGEWLVFGKGEMVKNTGGVYEKPNDLRENSKLLAKDSSHGKYVDVNAILAGQQNMIIKSLTKKAEQLGIPGEVIHELNRSVLFYDDPESVFETKKSPPPFHNHLAGNGE